LAAALLAALPVASGAAEPPQEAVAARSFAFEETLDAAFATGDFVGLAVAVVRGDETTFLKTYGVREVGGAPVTPATVFRIASLSKAFAASLAALAADDGVVSLDAGAAAYAPELAFPGGAHRKLTLAHVLSHRTGLPPNAYDNLLEEGEAPEAILAKYKDVALVCPVGACYAYQNIAFDIVGRALSSVYGKPFGDLVRERLFVPLGMETASVGEEALRAGGEVATPHRRDRIKGSSPARYGPWRPVAVKSAYYRIPAAGGVNASILDMAEWLKAQMGARAEVLPPDVLALIHTPKVATPAETARIRPVSTRYSQTQYGYGWRIYAYDGKPVITHSGTVDGYAAQIAFLPGRNVGIVILSNAQSRRFWRILPHFLDIELGLDREDWLALKEGAAKAGSP
ncbi:MAG: beta-lactamase family protein, partial [Parvularculaceae bacterium]|nr:beta-lactamase family protein [Parvularculaceae bacterium]